MRMIRYLAAAACAAVVFGVHPGFAQGMGAAALPSTVVLSNVSRTTVDSISRLASSAVEAALEAEDEGSDRTGYAGGSAGDGALCGPGWHCSACSAGWQYEGSLSRTAGTGTDISQEMR